MMDFLNQCGPIEDRMDSLLRHELDIEVSMPVQFDIEFDSDEVCKDLQRRLDPEELLPRPAGSTLEAVKRELNEITKLKDEPEEEKANRRKIESTEDVCVLCVGLVIDGEVLAGDVGTRQLEIRDGGFAEY